MISSEQIRQAVERMVAAANPIKVILFGSYARGDATEDSDLEMRRCAMCARQWG